MQNSLIFDIGCHIGQDSDHYLRKGFRVVAVEANPALCEALRQRFSSSIAEGKFVLVESAIAGHIGEVPFFVNEKESIWGTIRPEMADLNQERFGAGSTKIIVPAITFGSLVAKYGVPYYLKIDIEGADLLCLEGLLAVDERPQYISYENEKLSFSALRVEMELLKKLGYTRFQIVDQGLVQKQKPPYPAKEGVYSDRNIEHGSTGLFGKELPGPWLSHTGAIRRYVQIYLRNRFLGLAKRLPFFGKFARRVPGSWYNTHAALGH